LAKNGKWFELKNFENQYDLKSNNFDDFHKYRFYYGIKWHLFKDFVSWFMDSRRNNQLNNILQNIDRNKDTARKKLNEFFNEGKDLNNQNIKNQILQIYFNFTFDFSNMTIFLTIPHTLKDYHK